jgi:transposase
MTDLAGGIDVSAASLTVAVWHHGRASLLGDFPNTPDGFAAIAAALPPADSVRLVLEPTGGYELAVAHFALAQDWHVSMPNPTRVRDFAKGRGRRAKTDRQDALMLALFAAEGETDDWHPLPDEVAELDSLQRRKDDLEHLLRQERNRRLALMGRPGQHQAVGISLQRVIEMLEEELAAVERALAQQIREHAHLKDALKRLRTVPGVGPQTVVPLLVLLWRWQVLTDGQGSTKGLVAYAGLDPQVFESGTSVRKRGTISRKGDRVMRRRLFLAVLGGARHSNALREFYQRLVGRGKRKMVAMVAAERKLLVWSWKVFQTQTEFDVQKATGYMRMS